MPMVKSGDYRRSQRPRPTSIDWLAQYCTDRALYTRQRQVRRLWRSARYHMARHVDATVVSEVAGSPLWMPLDHRLPMTTARRSGYARNLGRIAQAVSGAHPDGSILDIGANIGSSAAMMRSHTTAPILCFEGDPVYVSYLMCNIRQFPDVQVEPTFVSGAPTETRYSLIREHGTARLVSACGGDAEDARGVPLPELGRDPC
jgi:hypothetical protein